VKEGTTEKEGGVDVLSSMSVTAAVIHLEMSALNASAILKAVGRCRCRGEHNPKINKIEKTSKKKNNGREWTEFK
jgi:hypothetical protein